ncbi:hypothetical protein PVAP13_3NG249228 [Panicum virgatum]|uniref:PGG domain-containing protein n=1 Tax=Panicum virgatum TaxID=38727 RepID=A0A8T0U7D1_PANVG|nr:hypothetical protein PVAP13_3NG249228 [Panicum virgatum]
MASPQFQEPPEWEYGLRKYLLLLATVMATVTYSAGFNPPGGVWQDTDAAAGHLAGDPILRATSYWRYITFIYCNALAFVSSLFAMVLYLLLAILHEHEKLGVGLIVPLRSLMASDLLGLMLAYAAATCRDTFTIVSCSVIVGAALLYLAVSWVLASSGDDQDSRSGGDLSPIVQGKKKDLQQEEGIRKVLMVLATFAVSVTYASGMSTPGGFWDTAEGGHHPGYAILRDRHRARLSAFFVCNTAAFVASLLVLVMLLFQKLRLRAASRGTYGCILVSLVGLVGAYAAGSSRGVGATAYVLVLLIVAAGLVWVPWRQVVMKFYEGCYLLCLGRRPTYSDHGEMQSERTLIKSARNLVLLLATFATAITYQAGLHPPGGLWQQDSRDGHLAGDPILLATNARRDVSTSIDVMAMAAAVMVYVVIHVIFFPPPTLDHRNDDERELVRKTRKLLYLLATLATTLTYQTGLTPPSGSWPSGQHAGDPVLLDNRPRRYKIFFYCNCLTFTLSMAIMILLVNPHLYTPAIQSHALSVCMVAGLSAVTGAYAAGSTQDFKTSLGVLLPLALVISTLGVFFVLKVMEKRRGQEVNMWKEFEDSQRLATPPTEDDVRTKDLHATRKYLMLLGVLLASITYQAGLDPPGGIWQHSGDGHDAGNPVMQHNRRRQYLAFFYTNSTSFGASVIAIAVLLHQWLQNDEGWTGYQRRVMYTIIELDLLALLGAYVAGSSRDWKPWLYILAPAIIIPIPAVLAISAMRRPRRRRPPPPGLQI